MTTTQIQPTGWAFKNVCSPLNSLAAEQVPEAYLSESFRTCSTTPDDNSKILSLFTDETLTNGNVTTTISLREYLINNKKLKVEDHAFAHGLKSLTWADVAKMYYPQLSDSEAVRAGVVFSQTNRNAATPFDTLSPSEKRSYAWYRLTADSWIPAMFVIGRIPEMRIYLPKASQVVDACAVKGPDGLTLADAPAKLDLAIQNLNTTITNVKKQIAGNSKLEAVYTYYKNASGQQVFAVTTTPVSLKGSSAFTEAEAIISDAQPFLGPDGMIASELNSECKGGEVLLRDISFVLKQLAWAKDHLIAQGPVTKTPPVTTKKPPKGPIHTPPPPPPPAKPKRGIVSDF
jgi:hypothetical protein